MNGLGGLSALRRRPYVAQAGTLSFTDNFNRADENPLNTTNWFTPTYSTAFRIVSNTARGTSNAGKNYAGLTATALDVGNDHSAKIVLGSVASSPNIGVCVRLTNTKTYVLMLALPSLILYRVNIDLAVHNFAQIAPTLGGYTFIAGDEVELRAIGHSPVVLEAYYNGMLQHTFTDSTNYATTGFPGMYSANQTRQIDEFTATVL